MKKWLLIIFTVHSFFVFSQGVDSLGKNKEEILLVAEKMPEFPGGDYQRSVFIVQNINMPNKYKGSGKSFTVYVTFVVTESGKVEGAKILKGIKEDSEFDKEVLRLVSIMPNWIPGEQNGNKVKVQYNMPVKFTYKEDDYVPLKTK